MENVNPEGQGAEKGAQDQQPKSFDEVLKDKAYQSEFDKRLAKAIDTAKGNWESEYNSKLEEAKTEAQKMAAMNEKQKADYEQQKRISELEAREKEISTRELKAAAYETLAEKGLPKELAEVLTYTDAEACTKSIDAVGKAFQTSVEKVVNEKLRGNNPPKGGGQGDTSKTFGFNFSGVRPKK